MDLAKLEVLVAVAQERSFSRAAERLHRTQSAVSQMVRRLEDELEKQLFDRSSKDGTLTDAGRVLYDYALQMLNLRRDARNALQDLGDLRRGKVVIAANEYTVLHLLPILPSYREHHPEVKVEVRRSLASEIPSEVLRRDVELGLITYRPAQPELTTVLIARDELALIVAPDHPLARRAEVRVRELGEERFLAHNVRSHYRERVVRTFARHHTRLDIAVELPTLEAIKRLVEAGLGVSLMPRRVAQDEISRGDVVAVPVREMRLERSVFMVFRESGELSHAARAFVASAQERQQLEQAKQPGTSRLPRGSGAAAGPSAAISRPEP